MKKIEGKSPADNTHNNLEKESFSNNSDAILTPTKEITQNLTTASVQDALRKIDESNKDFKTGIEEGQKRLIDSIQDFKDNLKKEQDGLIETNKIFIGNLAEDSNKTKDKVDRVHELVYIGYLVILLMAATIIATLFIWLISGNISNAEKLYDFQILNNNNYNAQQTELNNLKYQNELFKKCLKNGGWDSCLNTN